MIAKNDEKAVSSGQRLYRIEKQTYVQGNGEAPPEVQAYMEAHDGESPPFMPLPREPVEFRIGPVSPSPTLIPWNGESRLPDRILEYVRNHGTLPTHKRVKTTRR